MAYFKFHKKKYWESSKLTDSKINPSRENHAHFIPCKPPHKNCPREYFVTTLWFIQIATSVVEKSQILSVAFHLSATVEECGGKNGKCYVASAIVSCDCKGDDNMNELLAALGTIWLTHLLFICKLQRLVVSRHWQLECLSPNEQKPRNTARWRIFLFGYPESELYYLTWWGGS